jgi:prepilin-type N-terminal cleavage/methylation domain-containing protein
MMENKVSKPKQYSAGFTLLEVLVASVILISAIAAISLSYRGALVASQRADINIQIAGVMPIIVAQVSERIKQLDDGGTTLTDSAQNFGVNYSWQAELINFKAPPERFDPDEANFIQDPARFRLWRLNLQVEKNGLKQQYQYNELSWLNEK